MVNDERTQLVAPSLQTPAPSPSSVPELVDHLFRHQAGQVVAALTRLLGVGNLQLAEDVVQETLLKALRQWPHRGVPDNPGGWITRVARNQALDVLRRDGRLAGSDALDALPDRDHTLPIDVLENQLRDDQLRMIFTCCHPALSRPAQVALTLKTVGGFGVSEIARAFLVPEATIAQRLVRAKRTLRERNVAFDVPEAHELPDRLQSVLDVLYLLFNEGYSAHSGDDLVRHQLCAEAIRLLSLLAQHPAGDQPHVHALLALMLLQASRLPARTDAGGDLLLLDEQDRTLWDRRLIRAGLRELDRSARGDVLSAYHLQAGIAACHAVAPSYASTDWDRILAQYDALIQLTDSPVVALNRAVALAEVAGAEAGLREIERTARLPGMESYYLLHATTAELCRRAENIAGARQGYERSLLLTANAAEQRFLRRKLAALDDG
jgi:RNA polymerase sigma factor (sigma-70 family)